MPDVVASKVKVGWGQSAIPLALGGMMPDLPRILRLLTDLSVLILGQWASFIPLISILNIRYTLDHNACNYKRLSCTRSLKFSEKICTQERNTPLDHVSGATATPVK